MGYWISQPNPGTRSCLHKSLPQVSVCFGNILHAEAGWSRSFQRAGLVQKGWGKSREVWVLAQTCGSDSHCCTPTPTQGNVSEGMGRGSRCSTGDFGSKEEASPSLHCINLFLPFCAVPPPCMKWRVQLPEKQMTMKNGILERLQCCDIKGLTFMLPIGWNLY